MGKRKTPAKSSKAKQPTITSHALPLPKKPMELVGKQIGVPGAWWEGTRRTRSKAARPAHALRAAAERRAGSGAPGRGAAWPGERPGWTTRGWERRLRRAGTSVFTEYSLFMMNRRCSTHSHELERGRSIQVMNILRAVNSTQVILFITRPGRVRPPRCPASSSWTTPIRGPTGANLEVTPPFLFVRAASYNWDTTSLNGQRYDLVSLILLE